MRRGVNQHKGLGILPCALPLSNNVLQLWSRHRVFELNKVTVVACLRASKSGFFEYRGSDGHQVLDLYNVCWAEGHCAAVQPIGDE